VSADYIGSAAVSRVVRYSFRPVSTTETVAEASSDDEVTEKIHLGEYEYFGSQTTLLRDIILQILRNLASSFPQ